MAGSAWTSIELELDWSGDFDPVDFETGESAGWENVTLDRAYFDITDFKVKDGQLVKTTRTVEFVLTPEQIAQLEALFSEDAAEAMSE